MTTYSDREGSTQASRGFPVLPVKAAAFMALLVCLSMVILMPRAAYGAASVDVTLTLDQIIVKPTNSAPDDTFIYTMEAKAPGNPMPAGTGGAPPTTQPGGPPSSQFTLTGTASAGMGPITYSTQGVYVYEISLADDTPRAGYTLDARTYTVSVYVTLESTGLAAQVTIEKGTGEKADGIEFTHSYAPSPAITVDPPVKKQVQGDIPTTNATFTFKLEARDRSNPMPEGSSGGVKYMDIVGAGERDFGTWDYTRPGTYYYTVSEVNRKDGGYAYDSEVYTITDAVTDENGKLVNVRTVTNSANKQVEAFLFVNTYTSQKSAAFGPKTGDGSNVGLYASLLAVGLGATGVAGTYLMAKSKKRQGFLHA